MVVWYDYPDALFHAWSLRFFRVNDIFISIRDKGA